MDLVHLRTFSEVARTLSFTRAATRLGYVQSTVSAQIRALENALRVRLFDRLGRSIRLTPAGEVLLKEADGLLAMADAAEEAVRLAGADDGTVTGRIAVSAPESLLTYRLPALIGPYHRSFPHVQLSLRPAATARLRGAMHRGLADGTIDVALVLDDRVRDERLTTEILWEEPVTVIAPEGHPLAAARTVSPDALVGETILLPEASDGGCAYRAQFEDHLRGAVSGPFETLEFASVEAVKQCVAAGIGISALPTTAVAAELEHGQLAALTWSGGFSVYTQLAWNPRRWQSPAMRAFLDLARKAAKGGPTTASS